MLTPASQVTSSGGAKAVKRNGLLTTRPTRQVSRVRGISGDDLEAIELIVAAAESKKAISTSILRVSGVHSLVDYFVVTSASNSRQLRAIVEAIDESISKNLGAKPLGIEGLSSSEWILLDYGSVVVHVFSEEARSFYSLERLWSDAERMEAGASNS